MNGTIRVSPGTPTVVGLKWSEGSEPMPHVIHESVIRRGIRVPLKKGAERQVAAVPRVVHEERYKPNLIPKGVDLNITLPHDCANHLPDVAEVERGRY